MDLYPASRRGRAVQTLDRNLLVDTVKLGTEITRREALKIGGLGAVGLAFTKPLIDTIYPKPAFAS